MSEAMCRFSTLHLFAVPGGQGAMVESWGEDAALPTWWSKIETVWLCRNPVSLATPSDFQGLLVLLYMAACVMAVVVVHSIKNGAPCCKHGERGNFPEDGSKSWAKR